jgi:hypothetical protein
LLDLFLGYAPRASVPSACPVTPAGEVGSFDPAGLPKVGPFSTSGAPEGLLNSSSSSRLVGPEPKTNRPEIAERTRPRLLRALAQPQHAPPTPRDIQWLVKRTCLRLCQFHRHFYDHSRAVGYGIDGRPSCHATPLFPAALDGIAASCPTSRPASLDPWRPGSRRW